MPCRIFQQFCQFRRRLLQNLKLKQSVVIALPMPYLYHFQNFSSNISKSIIIILKSNQENFKLRPYKNVGLTGKTTVQDMGLTGRTTAQDVGLTGKT